MSSDVLSVVKFLRHCKDRNHSCDIIYFKECNFNECRSDFVNLYENLSVNRSFDFVEVSIDGKLIDIYDLDDIPAEGALLNFKLKCPRDSASRIYSNFNDLCENSNFLSAGLPEYFYIFDIAFWSGDDRACVEVDSLKKLLKFIKALRCLSVFSEGRENVLIFSGDGAQALKISIDIDCAVNGLVIDVEDYILESLLCLSERSDFAEKSMIFKNTIYSYYKIIGTEVTLSKILSNWASFYEEFENNYKTYLNGFSFSEAVKEVAKIELEISEKYSKVLSEISGKFFASPISLAAVALVKRESIYISLSVLVGSIFISVVIVFLLKNQTLYLDRIKKSQNFYKNSLLKKKVNDLNSLHSYIEGLFVDLDESEKSIRRTLLCLKVINWFPPLVILFIIIHMWSESINGFLLGIYKYFNSWFLIFSANFPQF